MQGLEELRKAAAEFLRKRGIEAAAAWDGAPRVRRKTAAVAVSLRSCEGGPAGLRDYLGERFDRETGRWKELYGKRATITLGLDIYAPEELGENGCAETFARLSEALADGGPAGLKVLELSCGETRYDRDRGLFCCPVRAVCQVYLYAVAEEGGEFTDFKVRGITE